jgi:hypothetical protein
MIDGLAAAHPHVKFEHLAMWAIYFHGDQKVPVPDEPLRHVRRMGLSPETEARLQAGWLLRQWGPDKKSATADKIGGTVDRIRKKMRRVAAEKDAQRWRHHMRVVWASLFVAPNLAIIEAALRQIGEEKYFWSELWPRLETELGLAKHTPEILLLDFISTR